MTSGGEDKNRAAEADMDPQQQKEMEEEARHNTELFQ